MTPTGEGSDPKGPAAVPGEAPPNYIVVSPPAPTRRWGVLGVMGVLFGGVFLGSTCSTCATMQANQEGPFAPDGPRVGVVEVLGAISSSREVVEALAHFSQREEIAAVVLRVDSPGGSVGPSQEIYEAVRRTASVKPVVASMGSVAASGGFWISLGADEIFANPGTITGSIGVIVQIPDLTKLAQLLRFDIRVYKSAPQKDLGNPLRPERKADREIFQALVDDVFAQFVDLTAERRDLPVSEVKAIADGRVLTGRTALSIGLVDGMGGLETAARRALALSQETATSTDALSDEAPILVYPPDEIPPLLELIGASLTEGISEGLTSGLRSVLGPQAVEVH